MTPSSDRSLRLRAIFPPYPPIPFFATTRWQGMSSNMRLAPQADPTALAARRIADHGGQFTVGTHLTIGNALHTAPHPLLKGRAVGCRGRSNSRRFPARYSQIWPAAQSVNALRFSGREALSPAGRPFACRVGCTPSPGRSAKDLSSEPAQQPGSEKKAALTANASAYIVTCPKLV